MKKIISVLVSILLINTSASFASSPIQDKFDNLGKFISNYVEPSEDNGTLPQTDKVILGNERLLTEYSSLINGKKLGLVTNQTGVDSNMIKTVNKLYDYNDAELTAIYSPEHGLDGKILAGQYVDSYVDKNLNLPVYSLYGKTREPSKAMVENVDVILFDMQDIGSRTYTYMSTLNYVMRAGKKYDKPVIILDRPNPIGGNMVDGYVAQDKYLTFVGVDNLPLAHGMTAGELAQFFNRKIGADITVVPMKNYTRDMVWQDTGLKFVATSPKIPDIYSAFCYIATGMGDGTGIGQDDYFKWVGSAGIDSVEFAKKLNASGLEGINFSPETRGSRGGARLNITNFHKYNPVETSIYIISIANSMKKLSIPIEQNNAIPMFEKIWGGNRFGNALKNKWSAEKIIASYQDELNSFKSLRKQYLIY